MSARSEPEVWPNQGERAGFITRMTAAILDAVVLLVIVSCEYGMVAGLAFLVNPLTFGFPRPARWLTMGVALASTVGYLAVAWTISGRTCGAVLMGLRVVGPDGRLGPIGALVRAVLCAVFPVGLLWCAVNARNRSLQDIVLRTSVVYDWSR
jgi:uncharacterized RDD family membrane protein YckC